MESVIYPLLAVSDQVLLAIVTLLTAVVATAGAAFSGYLALRQKSLDHKLNEQGKDLKDIARDTKATYTFQNHQMGVALKGVAVACRAKAEITKKGSVYDKADLAEAEAAENAYNEHQLGQRRVDAQALITRAEEQARDLLLENQEQLGEPHTTQSVAEAVVEQLGKTHDIEGTVELTPKDSKKES